MICTSSNWEDIRRYFAGTYVKFREYGDKLFFIHNVDPALITGFDEDEVKFELYLSDAKPYTLDYILPSKAAFQYKNGAHILQRQPARQYRRGLCEDNTQITRCFDGQKVDIDFDILKAFVNKPVYTDLNAAVLMPKGTHTVSRRMWYNSANGYLCLDMKRIGMFDKKANTLLINTLFTDDVKSMLGTNSTIKVATL